ncbi:hypothetical protein [Oceanithermus desulfurans]|uniref:ABC-type multidrug transport system permease subunit n=1 Tax=Oceanithermus desulfurans TaxID=227924 RepID=A0ABR6P6A0_9DEIN|nr:hypothetical protein [Oceanithermus desulfurans]MBB6029953.1 ABC-type multidrug transport system permease subunit [Oceanithermus desulfurans]
MSHKGAPATMGTTNQRVFSLLASYLNGLLVVAFVGAANRVVCGPAETCHNFLFIAPFAISVLVVSLLVSLLLVLIRDGMRFLPLHIQTFFLAAFTAGLAVLVLVAFYRYAPIHFADTLWLWIVFPLVAGLSFWALFLSKEVRRAVEALLVE